LAGKFGAAGIGLWGAQRFGYWAVMAATALYTLDRGLLLLDRDSLARIVRAEFLRGVLAFRRGDRDEARDIFRGVLERVPLRSEEVANQLKPALDFVWRAYGRDGSPNFDSQGKWSS